MADEQPQTPSSEPRADDATTAEPSSADSEAQASSPSWWSKLFHRRGDPEPEPEVEDATTKRAPSSLTLSQEELDKRIQAEADRRDARRLAEQRAAQKRELRDSDPWAYVEQERNEEQAAQAGQQMDQLFANIGSQFDRTTMDPLVERLPVPERERILKMDGAGRGLDGRKLVVTESLKALEKHWRAEGAKDAETKLRRNPAFRKQVLSELRGQTAEPELLPSGSPSEADKTVSGILREYYRLG